MGADRVRRLLEAEKRTGTRATYIIADARPARLEAEELRVRAVKTSSPLGSPGRWKAGKAGRSDSPRKNKPGFQRGPRWGVSLQPGRGRATGPGGARRGCSPCRG